MTHKNDTNPTVAFKSALSGICRNSVPIQPDTQREPVCHFREALMDEILAKHPRETTQIKTLKRHSEGRWICISGAQENRIFR